MFMFVNVIEIEKIENRFMSKPPTLLVPAAEMATRYGSLIQVNQFGPYCKNIMDAG